MMMDYESHILQRKRKGVKEKARVPPGASREATPIPAPGELEIVRAFLSTRDAKSGADELRSSRDLSHWLSRHGLLPAGTKLTEEDLERALEVRRGLRALAVANSGGELKAAAVSGLDQAAVGARAQVRFDADGASRLELVSRDFDDALGTLLGIVHSARMSGRWRSLKICGDPGCRRAYFDFTKSQTGRWCTRRCGARMRARTARRRAPRLKAPRRRVVRPPSQSS